ncbi:MULTISPECIES: hypothetical protein [Corynebacterium]|uniref:hypothetical protein n=1 Tax=Corynebacterium TaxID=1716 RepID=UPI00124C093C|nr:MULTISPECIES: hypothetical protein [Corynebacterium]
MYTLTAHWNHNLTGEGSETITADSYEALVSRIIEENDRWYYRDLAADYWPELYWDDPEGFEPWDEDEEKPQRREITEDIITGMAASVWDTSKSRIVIEKN